MVVLVRLHDRARGMHLQEVHGDVEVMGGEVREAVRGQLVGHRELVAQVLDRQLPLRLRGLQERARPVLGHEHRRGQVVHLHPLPQQLAVVRGLGHPQHVRGQCLQHGGARVGGVAPERQVDPHGRRVGDRACGVGEVRHGVQGEAELLGEQRDLAVGERSAAVTDPGQQLARRLLEGGVVVARLGLLLAQLPVDPPRLLRGRRALLVEAPQLLVQGQDRLDRGVGEGLAHGQVGEPEPLVEGPGLRLLERDLERRPTGRRLGIQQVLDPHLERAGDPAQLSEAELAPSVLDHRQLRGGPVQGRGELGEGQAPCGACGADPSADEERVDLVVGVGRAPVDRGGGAADGRPDIGDGPARALGGPARALAGSGRGGAGAARGGVGSSAGGAGLRGHVGQSDTGYF